LKTKNDFITNSSSTCFCGWGVSLDSALSNFPDEFKKIIFESLKRQENNKDDDEFTYEYFLENTEDFIWDFHKFLKKYNITMEGHWTCDEIYIGIKPEDIPEDKTIRQVKDETKQKLAELGFDVSNFDYIEESWYDG
jgi:hypothetical protein